jgi:hypothetical protein
MEPCEVFLAHYPGLTSLAAAEGEFKFEFAGNDEHVLKLHQELLRQGLQVMWFEEQEADLEEAFMKITQGLVA